MVGRSRGYCFSGRWASPAAATRRTVAPSAYRQGALCLRGDRMIGDLAEPTGFLLNLLTGTACVTHTVSVSHAAAPLGGS